MEEEYSMGKLSGVVYTPINYLCPNAKVITEDEWGVTKLGETTTDTNGYYELSMPERAEGYLVHAEYGLYNPTYKYVWMSEDYTKNFYLQEVTPPSPELDGDVSVSVHTLDGTQPLGGTVIYAKDLTTDLIYQEVGGSGYHTSFSIRKDRTTEIWAKLNYSGRLTNKVQLYGDQIGGQPNFNFVVNLHELPPEAPPSLLEKIKQFWNSLSTPQKAGVVLTPITLIGILLASKRKR